MAKIKKFNAIGKAFGQAFPAPVVGDRAPSVANRLPIGQTWVDQVLKDVYFNAGYANGQPVWINVGGGSGDFSSLTVNPGPTSLTGVFTSTGPTFTVTTSGNTSGAIYMHANGGALERIRLHADQGTAEDSVRLESDAGGVYITGGLANGNAINLINSNAAGGIDIDAGTAGLDMHATGGPVIISSDDTEPDSIVINATGGGVTIDANGALAVTVGGGIGLTTGTGDVTATGGNLIIATSARQLRVQGGAVTDFIGTATLTNGTVTVANTNIAAGDRIIPARTAVNASSVLGMLVYSITPATSFTVEARIVGTPASIETNDQSSFAYFIVREI